MLLTGREGESSARIINGIKKERTKKRQKKTEFLRARLVPVFPPYLMRIVVSAKTTRAPPAWLWFSEPPCYVRDGCCGDEHDAFLLEMSNVMSAAA